MAKATKEDLNRLASEMLKIDPSLKENTANLEKFMYTLQSLGGASTGAVAGIAHGAQRLGGSGAELLGKAYQGYTGDSRLADAAQGYLKNVDKKHEEMKQFLGETYNPESVEVGAIAGPILAGAALTKGVTGATGWERIKSVAKEGAKLGGVASYAYSNAPDIGTKLTDAAAGAGVGAGLALGGYGALSAGAGVVRSAASGKAGQAISKALGKEPVVPKTSEDKIVNRMVEEGGLTPDDVAKSQAMKETAKEIGVPLTPGQATGSQGVANVEGMSGGRAEQYLRGQEKAVKQSFTKEFMGLPDDADVGKEIKSALKAVDDLQIGKKQVSSSPVYKAARQQSLSPDSEEALKSLRSDPRFSQEMNAIEASNTFRASSGDYTEKQVGYWHELYQQMIKGGDKQTALALKSRLNNAIDNDISTLNSKVGGEGGQYVNALKEADDLYMQWINMVEDQGGNVVNKGLKLKSEQSSRFIRDVFVPKPGATEETYKALMDNIAEVRPDVLPKMVNRFFNDALDKANSSTNFQKEFYNQVFKNPKQLERMQYALEKSGYDTMATKLSTFKQVMDAIQSVKISPRSYTEIETIPGQLGQALANQLQKLYNPYYERKIAKIMTSDTYDKAFMNVLNRTKGNESAKILNVAKLIAMVPVAAQAGRYKDLPKQDDNLTKIERSVAPTMRQTKLGPMPDNVLQQMGIDPEQFPIMEQSR